MISNFRKNCMGTTDFDGKFNGMRKSQEFIVYPITDKTVIAIIQSDTRIGATNLETGEVLLTKSIPSGAYNHHLSLATNAGELNFEELFMLKSAIFSTANGKAGNRGVYTDNSGALEVFN